MSDLNDFEQELRKALGRKQPSDGFARRVLEQTKPERSRRNWQWSWRWNWAPAAIAASLVLGVSGIYWQRERQTEQARQQLQQALEITARTISHVERVAVKNLKKDE